MKHQQLKKTIIKIFQNFGLSLTHAKISADALIIIVKSAQIAKKCRTYHSTSQSARMFVRMPATPIVMITIHRISADVILPERVRPLASKLSHEARRHAAGSSR